MKELIGKKVKEMRFLYNQTQEELAKALGVSKEFISMIESGKRLPSLETMSKLGKIFNKGTDFFLREEEEPFAALFLKGPAGSLRIQIVRILFLQAEEAIARGVGEVNVVATRRLGDVDVGLVQRGCSL